MPTDSDDGQRARLAHLWAWFADSECRGYSPLYEQICRAVAADAEVLELVRQAPPAAHLPMVLLAAVHDQLLAGLDHPLAAVYRGESAADPGPLFIDVCRRRRDEIGELLATRRTNTNEVGRSAVIGPALTRVANLLGYPLALIDVGCSAGLNLLCDGYFLDYGDAGRTGPHDATVAVRCDVIAGRPPIAAQLPTVAYRVGIDRDPVELADETAARWLLACVWPDTGRLERTRGALEAARRAEIHLLTGDAIDILPGVLARVPEEYVPVVVTTAAFGYFSIDARHQFSNLLAAASQQRSTAWISLENPGVVAALGDVELPNGVSRTAANILGLVINGPNGQDVRLLGVAHSHGQWLDWRAN